MPSLSCFVSNDQFLLQTTNLLSRCWRKKICQHGHNFILNGIFPPPFRVESIFAAIRTIQQAKIQEPSYFTKFASVGVPQENLFKRYSNLVPTHFNQIWKTLIIYFLLLYNLHQYHSTISTSARSKSGILISNVLNTFATLLILVVFTSRWNNHFWNNTSIIYDLICIYSM